MPDISNIMPTTTAVVKGIFNRNQNEKFAQCGSLEGRKASARDAGLSLACALFGIVLLPLINIVMYKDKQPLDSNPWKDLKNKSISKLVLDTTVLVVISPIVFPALMIKYLAAAIITPTINYKKPPKDGGDGEQAAKKPKVKTE